MKLFHGTSEDLLGSIIQDGLIPQKRENWTSDGKVKGFLGGIYLTNESIYAEWFGYRSALMSNNHDAIVILTVDVDPDNLYPDENHLVDYSRVDEYNNIDADVMTVAVNLIEQNKILWRDCLDKRGLVIHKGVIEPRQIAVQEVLSTNNIWCAWLAENSGTVEEFDKNCALSRLNNLDMFHWKIDGSYKQPNNYVNSVRYENFPEDRKII